MTDDLDKKHGDDPRSDIDWVLAGLRSGVPTVRLVAEARRMVALLSESASPSVLANLLARPNARQAYIVESYARKAVYEPADEGGFTVTVPALRGCISEGDTREEAERNIREAIELYLATRNHT